MIPAWSGLRSRIPSTLQHSPSASWTKLYREWKLMLNSIDNNIPSFSFMTNVHSDRNYIVKWTFATEKKPVFIPIEHIADSRNIISRQYAHINANFL